MNTTEVIGGNLDKLIDHLPVVVFEYTFFPNRSRGFTYISPRSEELLGLHPGLIMEGQLHFNAFIHPEDLASFHQSVESSMEQLTDWSWKGRCKGKNGYLWIETKSTPTRMSDGRVVYHGIFADMSERRRMEEQQYATEQRYRELVEQLPLGIAIHAGGRIKFINAAAARMIGANHPDEVIGMEAIQFVHPEGREVANRRVERILQGHSVEPLEQRFVRLDGKELYVESAGHPYWYEGVPAVQVIFSDITERKKTEDSFRKTETLFFQLFQNTPLAVVMLNERSEVVQINKGFEELFGYPIDELRGHVLTEAIIPPELEVESKEINDQISANRVIRVETVRQRKNRQKVSVIIYGVPVVLHDRKIGIFGMYVDITERQKVEEELKVRNTELDNFVYKVSHDLRAPLSSVLGLAHLATIPGNNDDLATYVRLMGQKATQLDHFISDVLSHSKNLKMEVKVERVNFHAIIDRTFKDLSYLSGAEEMKRKVSIEGLDFYSDPWRIAEIFRNLVSNSIKYRKVNDPNSEVSISVNSSREACRIVFMDNGIGVEEAHLPRIFEMFYRASNQSDGSGLGLYIVRNAIDKLGGSVSVDSKLNEGTRFQITLPNLPVLN